MSGDLVVYDRLGTFSYVGLIEDGWWQWPAMVGGWGLRRACDAPDADDPKLCELDADQAYLALALSGVDVR